MQYQDPTVSNANYLRQPLYAQGQQQYSEQYAQPSAPPPPPHVPSSAASSGEKFSSQGYKDGVWAILFLVHVVGYFAGGGYVLHKYAGELTVGTNSTAPSNSSALAFASSTIVNPALYSSTWDPTLTAYTDSTTNGTVSTTDDHIRLQRDVILLGLSTLGISAIVALLWLSLTKAYARTMIYAALVSDVAVSVLMVIVCLFYGAIIGVILFAVFAALKILWVYWMRSRIELAAVILTHAVHCIQTWPATIAAAFLSIFMQAMWTMGWGFCTVGYYYAVTRADSASRSTNGDPNAPMQQDSALSYVVIFLTLVSFYWTSQVIKNCLHVTVAGVAATWYFLYPNGNWANPTASSMKRALTTSFGSICLGSLILSVIRAARVTVNIARSSPSGSRNAGAAAVQAVCLCLVSCLLSILDRVVEYVNSYAFSRVAIYGQSYCEAAHGTWELFKVRGFDAFFNDSIIGTVLGFACFMGGLTSAAACALLSHLIFTEGGVWWIWALIGFVIGFSLTMCATEVVDSAVIALFVCLAEAPDVLQQTKPEEYQKLVPVIQSRYPQINFVAF